MRYADMEEKWAFRESFGWGNLRNWMVYTVYLDFLGGGRAVVVVCIHEKLGFPAKLISLARRDVVML